MSLATGDAPADRSDPGGRPRPEELLAEADRAVDPLEREDLRNLLYLYLTGTTGILIAGLFILGIWILPKPHLTFIEQLFVAFAAFDLVRHPIAFILVRRLPREGLRRFAFWLVLLNSFILTGMIYLSGIHTALVAVFLFGQLGISSVMLERRQVRFLLIASIGQFWLLVALVLLGVLPHEDMIVTFLDFRNGAFQLVTLLTLVSGTMFAVYQWTMYVRTRLEDARRELAVQATTDRLTGLPNRRSFDDALAREVRRARRTDQSLALLMCDVDHFKEVNDSYGHGVGDEVLRRLAAVLIGSVRIGVDTPARFGGEEFAVLLTETDLPAAQEVAERIRKSIKALSFHEKGRSFGVTMSLGVSALKGQQLDGDVLLEAADDLLYRAKKGGRDCVEAARLEELTTVQP